MSDTAATNQRERSKGGEAGRSKSSPGIIAQILVNIHNLAQASVWSYILFLTVQHMAEKKNLLVLQNKQLMAFTMYIQALQVMDALFGALGWTKTAVFQSIMQSIGRNTIAWLVFPVAAPSDYPAICLLAWAPADIIRYLNYLNDGTNQFILRISLATMKRYNAFLIQYPIGAVGEFLSNIYNYKGLKIYLHQKFGQDQIAEGLYLWLVIYPYLVFPGVAFNYYTLLKARSRFYKEKRRRQAAAEAGDAKKSE